MCKNTAGGKEEVRKRDETRRFANDSISNWTLPLNYAILRQNVARARQGYSLESKQKPLENN